MSTVPPTLTGLSASPLLPHLPGAREALGAVLAEEQYYLVAQANGYTEDEARAIIQAVRGYRYGALTTEEEYSSARSHLYAGTRPSPTCSGSIRPWLQGMSLGPTPEASRLATGPRSTPPGQPIHLPPLRQVPEVKAARFNEPLPRLRGNLEEPVKLLLALVDSAEHSAGSREHRLTALQRHRVGHKLELHIRLQQLCLRDVSLLGQLPLRARRQLQSGSNEPLHPQVLGEAQRLYCRSLEAAVHLPSFITAAQPRAPLGDETLANSRPKPLSEACR